MKIYLIRHGETTSDTENRYGGNYDDHLTPLGRDQLARTAENLLDKGIEIVFTSSLIRAKESGEIIASKINCPVEIAEDIQERNYGILAGLTKQEAVDKYPGVVEAHKNPENTDPEGESFLNFQKRTLRGFKEIFAKEYTTVAIVSHGGPIKQLLKYLDMPLPPKIGDGEITELTV
jgi:broad specificity phosphatase PhoE